MEDKQVELPFGCVVYFLNYTPERHQISKLTFPAEMRLFIPQNSSKNIITDLHKKLKQKLSPNGVAIDWQLRLIIFGVNFNHMEVLRIE